MTPRQRYDRQGLLALAPEAFGVMYPAAETAAPTTQTSVAVIRVVGPLDHHRNDHFDSYDAILDRVEAACQLATSHVVLVLDSPGGAVSGLFETADLIRECVADSGKTLTAYVEGQACSAAYALACAASRIVVCSTGLVGSIGVLDTRVDISAADRAFGVNVAFITSGTTKAYGHPQLALSAEELADRQRVVDQLAQVFFTHVKAARGLDPQPLEARIFPGQSAVAAGLADEVSTYGDLIVTLTGARPGGVPTMSAFNEARAALEKAAESDNEEEAKKAKAALAALSAEDESEDKPDDEEKKDDEPEAEKKDDEPEAKASAPSAISAATAGDLAATVQSLSAQVATLTSLHESTEKKALFASRPDVSKDLVKVLKGKPLAEVREILAALPRKGSQLAATAVVPATRGATQGDHVPATPTNELDRLDRVMGVTALSSTGVERTDNTLVLGAPKARKGA